MQSNYHLVREVEVKRSARVAQIEGMFDLASEKVLRTEWNVDLELPEQWNIGLIVGPSGSGKTTVANELFGDSIAKKVWPEDASIVDAFPTGMSIKEIAGYLSSVGLSSPPSWLKPYRVLSNGEQFRADLAAAIASENDIILVDEFTSVVDRTVAKIGSAAVQKTVRSKGKKFIAVACHYDIAEWLEPDWIYEPHENRLTVGRCLRRPTIQLEIRRAHYSAWQLFRKHHYLNTNLNKAAKCFVAMWQGIPVAFCAILPLVHGKVKNTWREHRLVVLPDYQGVSIGNRLSQFVGEVLAANGKAFVSTTSHPAMIGHRNRSRNWIMTCKPKRLDSGKSERALGRNYAKTRSVNRAVASFKFAGSVFENSELAKQLFA